MKHVIVFWITKLCHPTVQPFTLLRLVAGFSQWSFIRGQVWLSQLSVFFYPPRLSSLFSRELYHDTSLSFQSCFSIWPEYSLLLYTCPVSITSSVRPFQLSKLTVPLSILAESQNHRQCERKVEKRLCWYVRNTRPFMFIMAISYHHNMLSGH